jgi:hypothetical protein
VNTEATTRDPLRSGIGELECVAAINADMVIGDADARPASSVRACASPKRRPRSQHAAASSRASSPSPRPARWPRFRARHAELFTDTGVGTIVR